MADNIETVTLEACPEIRRVESVRAKQLRVENCRRVEVVNADVERAALWSLPKLQKSIAELAAQPRLIWLDLRGSTAVLVEELVMAQSLLLARDGALLWPSRDVLNAAISKTGDANLLEYAKSAAEALLTESMACEVNDQNRDSCSLDLTICIRYAKSMGVDSELIEAAESTLTRIQMGSFRDSRLFSQAIRNNVKAKMHQAAFKGTLFPSKPPEVIDKYEFINAAQTVFGLTKSEAGLVADLCDVEGKGFISEHDIRYLQDHTEMATMENLYELCEFIHKSFATTTKKHAYAAAFKAMAGEDAEISREEFEQSLSKIGWQGSRPALLFNALDCERRSGSIDIEEWSILGFYETIHGMRQLEKLKRQLVSKCGSLKQAWTVLDANSSGGLSYDELVEGLTGLNLTTSESAKKVFYYIDRDKSGLIGPAEFFALEAFNCNDFLSQIWHVREEMRHRHDSLGAAFDAMDKDNSGMISLKEWVAECEKIQLNIFAKIDCRVLYHFLNVGHGAALKRNDFQQLRLFNASDAQHGSQDARKRFLARCGTDPSQAFRLLRTKAESKRLTLVGRMSVTGGAPGDGGMSVALNAFKEPKRPSTGDIGGLGQAESAPRVDSAASIPKKDRPRTTLSVSLQALEALTMADKLKTLGAHRGRPKICIKKAKEKEVKSPLCPAFSEKRMLWTASMGYKWNPQNGSYRP